MCLLRGYQTLHKILMYLETSTWFTGSQKQRLLKRSHIIYCFFEILLILLIVIIPGRSSSSPENSWYSNSQYLFQYLRDNGQC